MVTTTVTSTAPHHLIADGEPLTVRRTRAGDAWEVRQRAAVPSAAADPVSPPAVLLGMPSRRG